MHVDAAFAGRTQAGGAVVHGMHVCLWALDALCAGPLSDAVIGAIQVKFLKFVIVDDTVDLFVEVNEPGRLRCSLNIGNRQIATILVKGEPGRIPEKPLSASEAVFAGTSPDVENAASLAGKSGHLQCSPNAVAAAADRFPALAAKVSAKRVAGFALMSTLVGMVSPGLHSIFSEFSVNLRDGRSNASGADLAYSVRSVDERFRIVQMDVAGDGFDGKVSAFIRQEAVPPPSMQEAALRVRGDQFADQRALVIGGSRGIGAVTALLLAAGGAQVHLTYNRNQAEAQAVVAAIAAAGGTASASAFDAGDPSGWSGTFEPTHLYFFATPKIGQQTDEVFDADVFRAFCDMYVIGFQRSFARANRNRTLQGVFYPSTVYVSERPRGMTEYAMAKAAGEELCRDLARQSGSVRFMAARLPRILTDQTATVPPVSTENALDVMPALLAEFASTSPARR